MLQTYKQNKSLIVAPCYRDRLGHPLLFSPQLLPNLKKIDDSSFGIRNIVSKLNSQIDKVELATFEVFVDINHKNTYYTLKNSFQKHC